MQINEGVPTRMASCHGEFIAWKFREFCEEEFGGQLPPKPERTFPPGELLRIFQVAMRQTWKFLKANPRVAPGVTDRAFNRYILAARKMVMYGCEYQLARVLSAERLAKLQDVANLEKLFKLK